MLKLFATEKFKEINLEPSLKLRYAISNYGRLISFTDTFEDGRIVNGSTIQGYRIFRYKVKTGNKISHKHKFFYKLVAEHFIEKHSEDEVYVLHLDRDRSNDYVANLKWATRAEMLDHQRKSPKVIEAREKLIEHNKKRNGHKLTATRVMLIKKRLADPKRKTRMKMIAKQFGISEMQLYRIKSGENWGHIKI